MAAVVVWVREAVSRRVSVFEVPSGTVVRALLPGSDAAPLGDFYVKCNGRRVGTEEQLQSGLVYSVEPRLCGGKGGFGSMLRALGAQIEKTTNREACRDLSGRRLRDVNHEKAMAEWIKKQAEREAEKEQRRLERLKRKLAEPKHYFTDPEYHQQCSDMSERLEDSVIKGLQASSSSAVSAGSSDTRKRKKEPNSSKEESVKKKCFWTGLEGLDASSGSDSDSESTSTSASCSSSGHRLQSTDSDSDGPGPCSFTNAASEQSPGCSMAGDSVAPDVAQPICDRDEQAESSSSIASSKPGSAHREESTGVEQPRCDHDQAESSSSITSSEPREESTGVEQPMICDPVEQVQSSSSIASSKPGTAHREESTDVEQPRCDRDEQAESCSSITSSEPTHREESTDVEQPRCDRDEQAESCSSITSSEPTHREESTDVEQPMICDPVQQAQSSSSITLSEPNTGHTEESTDVGQPKVDPEPEAPAATASTQQGNPNADTASFDLLAFSSASELESLGLEKLKVELMGLGLKCGGTLQERTARLFSVRGLGRAQIDPSLFAKPSKGKKK